MAAKISDPANLIAQPKPGVAEMAATDGHRFIIIDVGWSATCSCFWPANWGRLLDGNDDHNDSDDPCKGDRDTLRPQTGYLATQLGALYSLARRPR